MEKFVLTGYRYYDFIDNKNNNVKGYTLFLLQPVNSKDPGSGRGYMPLQFYDRYNNKPKFPSMSVELFEKFQVKNFKLNQPVEILFDRYNHLLEIKQ